MNAYDTVCSFAPAMQQMNNALGMPGLKFPCETSVRHLGRYAAAKELQNRYDESFGYVERNTDGTVRRDADTSEKILKFAKYVMSALNATEIFTLGQLAYKFYNNPASLTDTDFKILLTKMMTLTVHTGVRQQASHVLNMLAESRKQPVLNETPENTQQMNKDIEDAKAVLDHYDQDPSVSLNRAKEYLEGFLTYGASLYYMANLR